MAHALQERYAKMVLAKLRMGLVTKDNYIFNTAYEGDPKAGRVKIPVRDTEVKVRDYDKGNGIKGENGTTTYMDLLIDKDKAVNEIIDGYDAQAVPDGIVAERLDSAGYSMGLTVDHDSLALLESGGTPSADKTELTADTIYGAVVDARTYLSNAFVPTAGRWLIVSPETYGLLLKDTKNFIRSGDISQKLVEAGAVGSIAGFTVFEGAGLGADTEFVAGHPNWCHRVMDWMVNPYLQDLSGDADYIGASAVKGRMVYGLKISRPTTVYVKSKTGA